MWSLNNSPPSDNDQTQAGAQKKRFLSKILPNWLRFFSEDLMISCKFLKIFSNILLI